MGIWGSLTFQGKIAVAAVVLGVLLVLAYTSGDDNNASSNDPGFTTLANTPLPTRQVPAAAVSPTPQQSNVAATSPTAASPTTTGSSVAGTATTTPTGAPATATSSDPDPTSTTAPVVNTPVPPTPLPPTATPVPPGCIVGVSLAPSATPGNDSVTGQLTCNGAPGTGVMNAVFTYGSLSSGCSAASDGGGSATCASRVGGQEPGALVSVEACFSHTSGKYCGTASP